MGLLLRARLGAMLFPLGTLILPMGGPVAAAAFAVLYGMSNGILTINRGTLPLALLGPRGYATLLGWLAVPVLLAQAGADTDRPTAVGATCFASFVAGGRFRGTWHGTVAAATATARGTGWIVMRSDAAGHAGDHHGQPITDAAFDRK
jgi:hypothetical protein